MSCNCQKIIHVDVKGLTADEVQAAIKKKYERRSALHDNPASADRSGQDRLVEAAHVLDTAGVYDYTASDLLNVATFIEEN